MLKNQKARKHWCLRAFDVICFPKKSGYQDSNLGPPAPKAGALTGLRYIPNNIFMRREGDSNPRYGLTRTPV